MMAQEDALPHRPGWLHILFGRQAVHSLRDRLLRHVLWPLLVVWALGATLAVALAYYFVAQAYDRSLVDDAQALAAQVQLNPQGQPSLSLTTGELRTVLFDQTERVYFALYGAHGQFLAGHKDLNLDVPALDFALLRSPKSWVLGDLYYQGKELRAARVQKTSPAPFVLVVAQTTVSRKHLLERLLVYSIVPQILVLLLLAYRLSARIEQDLQPLSALCQTLELRDAADLQALPVELTQRMNTRDMKRLGRAVNDLFARVETGLQSQREFAGNVAHELRTPLAGIRAETELALAAGAWPASERQRLERVLQSEGRASHLLDQLLALAFADEAKARVHFEWVDLAQLVSEAVLRFTHLADQLQVDLGVDMEEGEAGGAALGPAMPAAPSAPSATSAPESAWRVWAQPVMIAATLDNLIDNALRHGRSPAGDSRVTVRLWRERQADGQRVGLAVEDNGVGLPSEQLQWVVTRWKHPQEDLNPGVGRGAGLGLAIVTRYAQLLQAELSFAPASSGQGLSVRLLLA